MRRALDAGASGYLLKDMPAEQLADAVRRVHRGLRVIDPQLAAEAWTDEADPLTERERQVLRLAGEGKASSEIATGSEFIGRHGAQLLVGSYQQARRRQPHRGRTHRKSEGVVVEAARQLRAKPIPAVGSLTSRCTCSGMTKA